jgi:hypothetical protein
LRYKRNREEWVTGGEKERGEEDIGNEYGFQKEVAIKDEEGRKKRANETREI